VAVNALQFCEELGGASGALPRGLALGRVHGLSLNHGNRRTTMGSRRRCLASVYHGHVNSVQRGQIILRRRLGRISAALGRPPEKQTARSGLSGRGVVRI
jgi:hypothetical protein